MRRCPYGTPLSSDLSDALPPSCGPPSPQISVVSFNLLADVYVRPVDQRTGAIQPFAAFEWVHNDTCLDWKTRSVRLLELLQKCGADVLCLQELQLERRTTTIDNNDDDNQEALVIPQWLAPLLVDYHAILPAQADLETMAARNRRVLNTDAAVTCAVLLRRHSVWERITPSKNCGKDSTTSVSVCLRHTSLPDMDPIVVSSVHLDATKERTRVGQLTKCLKRSRGLLKQQSSGAVPFLSTIVAGDMNVEFVPGSCVQAFLALSQEAEDVLRQACAEALRLDDPQPTQEQLEEWKTLQHDAQDVVRDLCVTLDRVETGPTRCAYDHPMPAGKPTMTVWNLDHFLYSSARLQPLRCWETLEADPESRRVGLPNTHHPSDHLAIGAVFQVAGHCRLDPKERNELTTQLESVALRHQQAVHDLDTQMADEQAAIEQRLRNGNNLQTNTIPAPPQTNSKSTRKQKKKKPRAPPPPEIQALLRRKRTLLKEQKDTLRQERVAFCQGLGDLHRLAIEDIVGCHWRLWAERGTLPSSATT